MLICLDEQWQIKLTQVIVTFKTEYKVTSILKRHSEKCLKLNDRNSSVSKMLYEALICCLQHPV